MSDTIDNLNLYNNALLNEIKQPALAYLKAGYQIATVVYGEKIPQGKWGVGRQLESPTDDN